MSSFFRGTLILMFAVLVTKIFGFIYRIQFMRVAGEEAVGIFNTAYPAFIFFLSLITLGLPIAVAKVIAELQAKGQQNRFSQVMRTSTVLTAAAAIVMIPLLILFIPFLSGELLKEDSTSWTLYLGLATVPIAAASGLIRGYFQGIARIEETAWSQILEQMIRIGLITYMLPYFIVAEQPAKTAAIAMFITLLSEAASLLYLWWKYRQAQTKKVQKDQEKSGYYSAKPLLSVAVPSAGSRLFGSFTWFLEPIIFLRALAVSGITAAAATTLYGIISGVLIPLLLFPSFIPFALSVVLVPAVSGAIAAKKKDVMRERIHLALRLSTLTGCFAATLFFVHGEEIAKSIFHISKGAEYMTLLAPIFFFYYIQSPLMSILQAMQEAKAAMMNSVYGGVGKLAVMFVLASQPGLQETGAVLAIGFGVLVTSFLHIATLRQKKETKTGFRMFVVPYGLFVLTCYFRPILLPLGSYSLYMDAAITLLMLLAGLIVFRQFKFSDLAQLKKLMKKKF